MSDNTQRSGFLELGSTSIKFYILDSSSGAAESRDHKVPWELGYDVFGQGRISPRSISHCLRVLKAWQSEFADINFRTITAIGTAALREAQNVDVFKRVLADEIGINIHIIEGGIEAFLLETGFRDMVETFPTALFDLGGGSLEIIEYLNRASTRKTSVPIGAIRLHCALRRTRDLFQYIKDGRQLVERNLRENLPDWTPDYPEIIGTGGTVRAIVGCRSGGSFDAESVDEGSVELVDLQDMIDREVRGKSWEQLPLHRRRLLLPGLLAIEGLFLHLGVKRVLHRRASVKRGLMSLTSMLPPAG